MFMIFCARWLIFVITVVVVVEGWRWGEDAEVYEWTVVFLLFVMVILALGANWLIALIWRHARPEAEFPEQVKTLMRSRQTFKSFPSDHTTIVTTLAIMSFFVAPSFLWFLAVVCASILVALARVYVGVHYPRDIIAGIVSGVAFFFIGGAAAFFLIPLLVR